ncbi:uncharacterized protein CMU_003060 [Cryptosporidium muris RN66]|uniref:Uncharacterized protein n=1 Tax=Cryptosporidium muris (strain RN66) TaxID=441375 RepID=B6AJT5_CRYMR|nr:uncharacterized protein CMU_003060 [Cryptosporidium muris RN66]EEA08476.1 hypothetical protein, conserved [Cryptosporidium muris RN66]|eukprot:XP_002142825.1 hypothetical protein [Cryptosporidium muris RN66]
MRVASLTIPRPTLKYNDWNHVSLVIKSSSGPYIISSWPFAFPRFKYKEDEILDICIYVSRNVDDLYSGSAEIYQIINFPCILLKDLNIYGKKQWILGLKSKSDCTSDLLSERPENAVCIIKEMEEMARRSFTIPKIYLIFCSCNNTIMNIEEQFCDYNESFEKINIKCLPNSDTGDNELENKVDNMHHENTDTLLSNRIKPDDSISKISGKTSGSNNVARTNLIKQNISHNSIDISHAIAMIQKHREKSLVNLKFSNNDQLDRVSNEYESYLYNNEQNIGQDKCDTNTIISRIFEGITQKLGKVCDSKSVISRDYSLNTKILLEKKITQEKLLLLQYYFSTWRNRVKQRQLVKSSRINTEKIKGICKISNIIDNKGSFLKIFTLNKLIHNYLLKKTEDIHREELKHYMREKENLILDFEKKLKIIIFENENKQKENKFKVEKLMEDLSIGERQYIDAMNKLELVDTLNRNIQNELENKKLENERLIKQFKELKSCLSKSELLYEKERTIYEEKLNLMTKSYEDLMTECNNQKSELNNLKEDGKKENLQQIEEIKLLKEELDNLRFRLNNEIEEKNAIEFIKNKLETQISENSKITQLCEDKLKKKIENMNKEYDFLKLRCNQIEEEVQILHVKNKDLCNENNTLKSNNSELEKEKSSLLLSVYDLINQVEIEKIERIQELENSRILFQSINYSNGNICNLNMQVVDNDNKKRLYSSDSSDNNDLLLEDLKKSFFEESSEDNAKKILNESVDIFEQSGKYSEDFTYNLDDLINQYKKLNEKFIILQNELHKYTNNCYCLKNNKWSIVSNIVQVQIIDCNVSLKNLKIKNNELKMKFNNTLEELKKTKRLYQHMKIIRNKQTLTINQYIRQRNIKNIIYNKNRNFKLKRVNELSLNILSYDIQQIDGGTYSENIDLPLESKRPEQLEKRVQSLIKEFKNIQNLKNCDEIQPCIRKQLLNEISSIDEASFIFESVVEMLKAAITVIKPQNKDLDESLNKSIESLDSLDKINIISSNTLKEIYNTTNSTDLNHELNKNVTNRNNNLSESKYNMNSSGLLDTNQPNSLIVRQKHILQPVNSQITPIIYPKTTQTLKKSVSNHIYQNCDMIRYQHIHATNNSNQINQLPINPIISNTNVNFTDNTKIPRRYSSLPKYSFRTTVKSNIVEQNNMTYINRPYVQNTNTTSYSNIYNWRI